MSFFSFLSYLMITIKKRVVDRKLVIRFIALKVRTSYEYHTNTVGL